MKRNPGQPVPGLDQLSKLLNPTPGLKPIHMVIEESKQANERITQLEEVSKEYDEIVARYHRSKFHAYVKAGFTEEQAMTLLVADINKPR